MPTNKEQAVARVRDALNERDQRLPRGDHDYQYVDTNDARWGDVRWSDLRALVEPPSTPTDAERMAVQDTLREVSAIILAEAYLPKFYPGGEADQEPPSCEGEPEGRWCQSVVDVVCDIRNRTLERVTALKSVRDSGRS